MFDGFPGAGIMDDCELPCGTWDLPPRLVGLVKAPLSASPAQKLDVALPCLAFACVLGIERGSSCFHVANTLLTELFSQHMVCKCMCVDKFSCVGACALWVQVCGAQRLTPGISLDDCFIY